jgi:hypothetical protein
MAVEERGVVEAGVHVRQEIGHRVWRVFRCQRDDHRAGDSGAVADGEGDLGAGRGARVAVPGDDHHEIRLETGVATPAAGKQDQTREHEARTHDTLVCHFHGG